ncbi:hypothetical protein CHARACLAT_009686 [Characodon lateralis]|uniref:Uncharacterized protein n=1 Tax=Characodon lateralis TaxID=208331 RepID=A0ABU7F1L1_9TELE|nr:hypothetical protein [Characodon lateralis]
MLLDLLVVLIDGAFNVILFSDIMSKNYVSTCAQASMSHYLQSLLTCPFSSSVSSCPTCSSLFICVTPSVLPLRSTVAAGSKAFSPASFLKTGCCIKPLCSKCWHAGTSTVFNTSQKPNNIRTMLEGCLYY